MSANTYKLKVDLKLKHTAIIPTFVQYDDARIDFQLFDNGKLFDLTGFTIVEVAHKRPDGTSVVGEGEIVLNEKGQKIVRYDYQGSEMNKVGFIETSFSIFDGEDNKISIQPFKVHILKDLRDGVIDPANPEFGLLQQYQAELLALKADLEAVKDETIQAKDDALDTIARWDYKGVYSPTKQYKKFNVVTVDGESYIAKQDTLGNIPVGDSNDLYWSTFARKGQDGTGTTVVYKDEFVATANQTVFTLSHQYTPLTNRLRVIVDGVEQFTPSNFAETANDKFTMVTGLTAGQSVTAVYFSQAPTLANDFAEQLEQMNTLVQHADLATLQAKADYAVEQGDYALEVAEANKTRFLSPVTTFAQLATTYPNPLHGDTAQVKGENAIYRFETGNGWGKKSEYDAVVTDYLSQQLAEKATKTEVNVKANKTYVDLVKSGTPKIIKTTIAELNTAYPTGSVDLALVIGNVKEVDTLNITAAPTASGNVTITLNGVAKTVAVTTGVVEVSSLTISAIPTTAGNITVTLNGVSTDIAVDPATDTTTDAVATKIRNTAFTGWTTGGTGSTITFTASSVGVKTDSTYNAGTTSTTGTMSTTTQGVDADTSTSVATKIRGTAFSGWITGGTGTTVTFTATAEGVKTAPSYSAGTTGATGTISVTTAGVNADGKWYYWNGSIWAAGVVYQSTGIGKGTVTPKETTFIEISPNLLNKDTMETGYSFDSATGVKVANALYGLSDFIKVTPNQTFSSRNILKIGRYDVNKAYISGHSPSTLEASSWSTTPATEFVRVVTRIQDYGTAQFNEGSALLAYEAFYTRLSNKVEVPLKEKSVGIENLKRNSVGTDNLLDDAITEDKVRFILSSSNVFNKTSVETGYSFDSTSGAPVANAPYALSPFIKVSNNQTFTSKNILKIGRYDGNNNYISRFEPTDLNSSSWSTDTAEYIRVVSRITDLDTAQLNIGGSLLPYEDFGYKLDTAIRVEAQPSAVDKLDLWVEDRFVIEGKLDASLTAKTLPADSQIGQLTTAQVITLYDQLMANYPDYITRTILGADSLGENIYRYDFKPQPVPTVFVTNEKINTKFPKMILISGVHGEEKAGVYNLFQAMKQITESWKEDASLETLRWNTHFIIVPVVNNNGFNNSRRQNENNIDIARNFPAGFSLNTAVPGDVTYGGTTPLSEKGSQVIAQLIDENKDAVYFTSFHNFTDSEAYPYMIWNAGATKLQVNLGKTLVSAMTRKWKKQYDWIPQDNTTYLGYADSASPNGSEGMYAASVGIHASTFETSGRMPYEPNAANGSSIAITLGVEAFLNWLILNLRENTKFYNNLRK